MAEYTSRGIAIGRLERAMQYLLNTHDCSRMPDKLSISYLRIAMERIETAAQIETAECWLE